MLKYFTRKLLLIVPTFIGITLIAFFLIRVAPGDPVKLLSGDRGMSQEQYLKLKHQLGFDRPVYEQYFSYLKNIFKGDLGTSVKTRTPVLEEFKQRFPATIELSIAGLMFAICLGIPIGIIAALRRNTPVDYSLMGTALIGYSMPIFWWGLLLILFFSNYLGWTPVSGRIDLMYDVPDVTGFLLIDTLLMGGTESFAAFKDALHHLILPAIALGTIPLAVIARMTRSSMLEVLGEDYVRTAKAKGLDHYKVIFVHALRNALIPVITVIGLQVSILLTGAILTETIFSWPGIGTWLLKSVESRDYPVVQGGILIVAIIIILVNTTVDLLYAIINPKIRNR